LRETRHQRDWGVAKIEGGQRKQGSGSTKKGEKKTKERERAKNRGMGKNPRGHGPVVGNRLKNLINKYKWTN
jgi:hypothetical protein